MLSLATITLLCGLLAFAKGKPYSRVLLTFDFTVSACAIWLLAAAALAAALDSEAAANSGTSSG